MMAVSLPFQQHSNLSKIQSFSYREHSFDLKYSWTWKKKNQNKIYEYPCHPIQNVFNRPHFKSLHLRYIGPNSIQKSCYKCAIGLLKTKGQNFIFFFLFMLRNRRENGHIFVEREHWLPVVSKFIRDSMKTRK